tara:strand:+ start:600 stop:902 length:303 start_codon:yes stop_codon:yes gene_type:complete
MSLKPDITDAVIKLTNQPFGWDGGEDCIVWPDTNTGDAPTRAEIDAKLVELQAEYDAQEYARNRQAEYPALAEQLDEIFHNGIDSWKAVIKVTKDKYPKG